MTMTLEQPTATGDAPRTTAAPKALAVECRGVEKTYSLGATKVHALRGIDLDVREGELMMLVGPSGCGKTTLISVVAGILDRDEGELRVLGEDVGAMSNRARTAFRGKNIGFVFQQFNLLPTLTAAENAAIPLLILKHDRKTALKRAVEALDRVKLADRAGSLPKQLSGGQQQRVAIARALVHRPRLIVCDEPTSALDHQTGGTVMDLLREVGLADGRSLVIVTHDARIFGYADRVAAMDDGRILSVGKPDESAGH